MEVVTDAQGARPPSSIRGIATLRKGSARSRLVVVDHPDFAYARGIHIDVPLEADGPYQIELTPGVALDIRPTIDGASTDLDNIFVQWSDGRSWLSDFRRSKRADGVLRIPAMPPGKNSILLVKLDGDRATHFSKITDVELMPGRPNRIDVP